MRVHTAKQSQCPYCDAPLNAASNADNVPPSVGDITMCYKCRNWLEFDENMGIVKTTKESLNAVGQEEFVSLKNFINRYFNQ